MPVLNKSSFYLPLVDITPFLEDPHGAAAQGIIESVRTACKSTGFFQIKGHKVPLRLQKSVFEASARFFALPPKNKLELDSRKTVGFRGYDVMETQSYELEFGAVQEADALRDIKEGFFIATDLPPDHPHVANGRFLQGPNVWPKPKQLRPEDFQSVLEEYYAEMQRLSHVVLSLLAATLPYGPHVFDELETGDPMSLLRLLHYPRGLEKQDGKKLQLGAGEHTDFGTFTLLLQDDSPGLEVQDSVTGEWHGVPPKKMWEYKSSVHRVWNRKSDDRYSVVFFYDGNLDYKVKPLRSSGMNENEEVDAPTIEEHVRSRLMASYGI
ncbi:putative 2-oxoglutarate-dependent dioxygenase [Penicillium robsamsonii]|uniref:putative 2-oxoglutarate-dependent dioxygenase n=1 Tax=Penicillium robsamsonii TaxID=1792511 RepID=UPI0025475D20|nr:putative 2-oxoglutarate-dependent dioxygenase [Penicillium robsamsonii]KAJ5822701.1 putative 2-oxoglutarate-dependent dioxygenase [Penicillium robsamsonii]